MADEEPDEIVTDADVRQAEKAAADADALVVEIEETIADGREDVTLDELEAQEKLSRFAKLRAEATRRKAERSKEAVRLRTINQLHDEILSTAPANGDKLIKALENVEQAALEFYTLAEGHDALLQDWRVRLERLGLLAGMQEQGVGLNGINQVIVDSIVLEEAQGARRLNSLFTGAADPYGALTPAPDNNDRRDATFTALGRIGKANS